MLNSIVSKLMGTPSTEDSRRSRINSTALHPESTDDATSPNCSNISSDSPSLSSSTKSTRENDMDNVCSHTNEFELSLNMKHNVHEVNLDDPEIHKQISLYLLEKVRDNESMIINLAKTNDSLRKDNAILSERVSFLQSQTDESINDLENSNELLKLDIDLLKENFDNLCSSVEESSSNFPADESSTVAVKSLVDENEEVMDVAANGLSDRVKALEEEFKATQARTWHNQKSIESLKEDTDELSTNVADYLAGFQKELIRLDSDIIMTNQYNRRENLIIDGIPETVKQNQLELACVDIIRKLGFQGSLGSYEIVGCHRLKRVDPNAPRPTIIRFFNRKISEFCKKNRSRLNNQRFAWKLSFREDLNKANEDVLTKAETLLKDGFITKLYTANGFVKIVTGPNEKPVRISHISELLALFPNQ